MLRLAETRRPNRARHVFNPRGYGDKTNSSPGSNCVFVDLCTAGLKAGAARHRLRRLTALTPSAHRSLGWACARQRPSGIARFVTGNIPFLAPRDHGVEDADELAHAGGERNLLLLSLGD